MAEKLGFSYLDTGAMYRASALAAIENSIPLTDHQKVARELHTHSIDVENGRILLDGRDVSALIRTSRISEAASVISSGTPVRRVMVELQRSFASRRDTVAEGRDMSTVVFPNADLKVYVIADVAIRVCRRWRELRAKGEKSDFHSLLKSQLSRDRRDRTRSDSPLRLAPGAVIVDSTLMSIKQQVSAVLEAYGKARFRKTAGDPGTGKGSS